MSNKISIVSGMLLLLSGYFVKAGEIVVIDQLPVDLENPVSLALDQNSFALREMNESRLQLWKLSDSGIPQLSAELTEVYAGSAATVQMVGAYADNWWVAGLEWDYYASGNSSLIHISQIKADSSRVNISFEAPAALPYSNNSFTRWHYAPALDELFGVFGLRDAEFVYVLRCTQALQLAAGNCAVTALPWGNFLALDDGFVLWRSGQSNNGFSWYQFDQKEPNGMREQHYELDISRISYWPTADRLQLQVSSVENGQINYSNYDLFLQGPAQGALISRILPGVYPSQHCRYLSSYQALCQAAGTLIYVTMTNGSLTPIIFDYLSAQAALPFGEVVAVHGHDTVVQMGIGQLTVYRLPLPQLSVASIPSGFHLTYGDVAMLRLAEILEDIDLNNVDIRVAWDPQYLTVPTVILTELAYGLFQFDTSKAIARNNPTGRLLLDITDNDWQSTLSLPLSIANINEAPVASATVIDTEPLEIGEVYELALHEVFTDPDGDGLTFSSTALPAGFVLQSPLINAAPRTPGAFSFTVTATDPAGLTASIQVRGTILPEKSSGGSMHASWLLGLLLLWRRFKG
ncbi:MAG: hypothetical protein CML20_16750 [Rheinheimera sp.]|uniref:Ig-like domain-containing protein n=1 Tax=Arsukibacterium sp. UBA3155 TaxID=1946058 RepID=UPI000C92EC1B|nr:putative Ig domain-containing protein [Arsukibacterium sp. UBA3155]MAD76410.1 hypothetical protein [Rheinheimera sp.]|tara:strand:+ start:50208 stop:51932 length:1725 start_codon:yes stop_codon:yes gene_type:complete